MKKRDLELLLACLLLACFYILARQAGNGNGRTFEVEAEQKAEDVRSAEPEKQDASGVIVIDAGHGGSDPGMIGVDRLEEKGINLAIAQILRELLTKQGIQVWMTRETDQGLYDENAGNKKAQDMARRIELIREKAPVLAVSIHQNSFSDPQVRGPQVFYFESSEEGSRLAEYIQNSLNEVLSVSRPREKKENQTYYLLKHSPAVLTIVECGFLTNPEEAALLQTREYQTKVAQAVADGILAYLEEYPES